MTLTEPEARTLAEQAVSAPYARSALEWRDIALALASYILAQPPAPTDAEIAGIADQLDFSAGCNAHLTLGPNACALLLRKLREREPQWRGLHDALRLVLPMARGYAAAYPVGSNQEYVDHAADVLKQFNESPPAPAEGGEPTAQQFPSEGAAEAFDRMRREQGWRSGSVSDQKPTPSADEREELARIQNDALKAYFSQPSDDRIEPALHLADAILSAGFTKRPKVGREEFVQIVFKSIAPLSLRGANHAFDALAQALPDVFE